MSDTSVRTLAKAAADLAAGRTTSRELVEISLDRIKEPSGQGSRAFLAVYAEESRVAADVHDRLRGSRKHSSPYAGIPISVKDLFDVAGDVTRAGSVVLKDAPAATRDAITVARLRSAGFIVLGRTNMTEFAFSGLGINPHYGTPLSPWDRATQRIPGGSSSGAAVCVSDGMVFGALGTDTGGSCRIPAAFCGVVGFKPTAARVPLRGAYPLSHTLDSIGPLANSVACCAALDAVLADEPDAGLPAMPLANLRFGVPQAYVLDSLSAEVGVSFERALRRLADAGARIVETPLRELEELSNLNAKGGFAAPEAFALHRERIESLAHRYDPRVLSRILRGQEQQAADYIELHKQRREFIGRVATQIEIFDAMLMPTIPIIAPALAEFALDETYARTNALVLRNSSVVNFLDGCAVSLPCHDRGSAPVGLSLFTNGNHDRRLLAIAAAVEARLQ